MIKKLNNKSLLFGVPGLFIQSVGFFGFPLISIAGTILLIIGLGYYAKAKGHSGYYGLFGLLSWFGILVLICLRDRHTTPEDLAAKKKTNAKDILLGLILGVGLLIGVPLFLFFLFSFFSK